MKEDNFLFLLNWYKFCFGNKLKNDFIINIFTIDNPGWGVAINLKKTTLENKQFAKIKLRGLDETDWIDCFIRDGIFNGACGPLHLLNVLTIFRKWVEYDLKENKVMVNQFFHDDSDVAWLQKWYFSQCDGDWEHDFGAELKTIDSGGWKFCIDLDYTELSGNLFQEMNTKNNIDDDWIQCSVEKDKFIGTCGPKNLLEVLKKFREWAES